MAIARAEIDYERVDESGQPLRPLTVADFLNTPDDLNQYEIVLGELIVSPPPMIRHQVIVSRLLVALDAVTDGGRRGLALTSPVGVQLSTHDIVQPDLVYVTAENLQVVQDKLIIGPPDLVVEVLSPSSRRRDLVSKRATYQKFGVREYWIVDPVARTVRVLTLEGEEYVAIPDEAGVLQSKVLTTLTLEIASVFTYPDIENADTTTPNTTG